MCWFLVCWFLRKRCMQINNIGETRASCHKAYIKFWVKTILTEKSELLLARLHQHIKALSLEPALVQVHFKRKKVSRSKSECRLYWWRTYSAQERVPLIGHTGIIIKSAQHFPVITLSATAPTSNTFTARHAASLLDPDPSMNSSTSWNTTKI